MLSQHDQASNLRSKVNMKEEKYKEDLDVRSFPPRSETHGSRKEKPQKETTQSGKIHIWITRGIVFAFLFLLAFIFVYFSTGFHLNEGLKKDVNQLIDVNR